MFARILEFTTKHEKQDDLIQMIRQDILPIMKKQPGFLELLPFVPDVAKEKMVTISLWTEKRDAERYVADVFPHIHELLKPFIAGRITIKMFRIETTVCQHFAEALTAAA